MQRHITTRDKHRGTIAKANHHAASVADLSCPNWFDRLGRLTPLRGRTMIRPVRVISSVTRSCASDLKEPTWHSTTLWAGLIWSTSRSRPSGFRVRIPGGVRVALRPIGSGGLFVVGTRGVEATTAVFTSGIRGWRASVRSTLYSIFIGCDAGQNLFVGHGHHLVSSEECEELWSCRGILAFHRTVEP